MALGGITTTKSVNQPEKKLDLQPLGISARVCRIGGKVIIHDASDTVFWEAARAVELLARQNDPANGGICAEYVAAIRRVLGVKTGPIIR